MAGVAAAAGVTALASIRISEGGAIEAAKAIKEGLTPEQQAAIIERCAAEAVSMHGMRSVHSIHRMCISHIVQSTLSMLGLDST